MFGRSAWQSATSAAITHKFVSQRPGIEVVLEAYAGYWRRVPHVKRLVMKSVPEATTRAVMLKSGEADISYVLDGPDAEDIQRDPRMQVVATKHASIFWIEFAEQWDPKSPWHDRRLRLAVTHALDRQRINEAACLGFCPPRTAVRVVMEPALRLIRGDPHQWSERPWLPRRHADRGRAARPAQLSAPLELLYRRALFSPKIARDSG